MILRELSDEQRIKLARDAEHWFTERNKGRVAAKPYDEASFMAGFSDGVRTILEKLEKLP